MTMQKKPEKASTSSSEPQEAIQGRPFAVDEQLAYIDDNASANSLPISYSTRRRDQEQQQQQQQPPVDANVVLKEREREQEKISLGRSQTQLEMAKMSG